MGSQLRPQDLFSIQNGGEKRRFLSLSLWVEVRLSTRCSATFGQLFQFRAAFAISSNFFLSKTRPQIKTNQQAYLKTLNVTFFRFSGHNRYMQYRFVNSKYSVGARCGTRISQKW